MIEPQNISFPRVFPPPPEVPADKTIRPALPETAEFYRIAAALKLDPKRRSGLGQYMTPAPISRFMASLFADISGNMRILDPGAGVGSLTAALVERCAGGAAKPRSLSLICYEIEPLLIDYLSAVLQEAERWSAAAHVAFAGRICPDDFILSHEIAPQSNLFARQRHAPQRFTHVIMNPPYKKIRSDSDHRTALRRAGLETSNLYAGFMFLAAAQLCDGGEMAAIIPRSFCNGPYFKPFRDRFFSMMTLRRIHLFEKRNAAFQSDEVLQENIIIHAVKGAKRSTVSITTSSGGNFEIDPISRECAAADMTRRIVDYASVIGPQDPDRFVHIAADDLEQGVGERISHFTAALADLGLDVSTGPVVDLRLKNDLRPPPGAHTAPLLYPAHFRSGFLEWPKDMKKPNAVAVTERSRKRLWKNKGCFVVTRRFTAKEERRRIVAAVYDAALPGEWVGFENHLNVYHAERTGFSQDLAAGLSAYLNSSLVDRYFRQFNGHTQVNATDLRSLGYPRRGALERIGKQARGEKLSQQEIDNLVESELAHMTKDRNPLPAQEKIDEALEIIKALGLPRGQLNERSALTLLALLDVKPSDSWNDARRPLMGITPIMEYCRRRYGREYAPNTRETFRRQTMHQFVEAGIALYNPDRPDRAVNSPKACYQVSAEAFRAIRTFNTDAWQAALDEYSKGRQTLAAKWAKRREMRMIPVQLAEGREIRLTPGAHSKLIERVVTEFAPRFAPGAEALYVGDTGNKAAYFQERRLAERGATVDRRGKMPDVVLYYAEKNWLLLVESVTSHGPVDAKRRSELARLFSGAEPGIVCVTAFPDRGVMARYLGEISWETEVWCADAPDHLIHFDGERFLGPHEAQPR